jgi:hypothetical protein
MLESAMRDEADGNWDDGDAAKEMGFKEGPEMKLGGTVDMDDDLYMEFEEDEDEVKKEPDAPETWNLLARYMANFKPSTKAMFRRFIDEVWHLRTGIEYSEKGKNYYMITLFSKGDYDFIMRGGPWIFNQHALIVTDFDSKAQPSETVLNSVPVWVQIYDVPWGKQDEEWGTKYGNGLGKTLEVDVPATEQQKKDFLRVRVSLPYDRRLQTQIITGVKGKPGQTKVFKLRYERVPYYCCHCGFMGHKKDECEKRKMGKPSMEYDAHELRCSPYKKFEHRSFFVPPAGQTSTKRGFSLSSFGSAESHKRWNSRQMSEKGRESVTPEQANTKEDSSDNVMPPLEDDPEYLAAMAAMNNGDMVEGKEIEVATMQEVESSLAQGVDNLLRGNQQPIIQFPDDEGAGSVPEMEPVVQVSVTSEVLEHLKRMKATQSGGLVTNRWEQGPRASDMIPALQGLSDLQVSFGSVNDVSMVPADTILGKRAVEEQEVQGNRRETSVGTGQNKNGEGGTPKKGRTQGAEKSNQKGVDMVYTRHKKHTATGPRPSGNLTRPNVWSRQAQ